MTRTFDASWWRRRRISSPAGCGLLLYKSYSLGTERILYKADAAVAIAADERLLALLAPGS